MNIIAPCPFISVTMLIRIKIKSETVGRLAGTCQRSAPDSNALPWLFFSFVRNPRFCLCTWVLHGGFLITVCTRVNWRLAFLKRKGNYVWKSTLVYLCTSLCSCVVEVVGFSRIGRTTVLLKDTKGDWFGKEQSPSSQEHMLCCLYKKQVHLFSICWCVVFFFFFFLPSIWLCFACQVFVNEFRQVNYYNVEREFPRRPNKCQAAMCVFTHKSMVVSGGRWGGWGWGIMNAMKTEWCYISTEKQANQTAPLQ